MNYLEICSGFNNYGCVGHTLCEKAAANVDNDVLGLKIIGRVIQSELRTAMNKLLIWKDVISKVLNVTGTEIVSLENEPKSVKSESGDRLPCSAAAGSLLVCHTANSCDKDIEDFDKVTCPKPLQIAPSGESNVEKMPLSTNLQINEDDINSPGTTTSKFVEALPMIKAVSSCDAIRYGTCSEDLDVYQSTGKKCLVPFTYGQLLEYLLVVMYTHQPLWRDGN
ncbi:hypothetical protein CR513_60994, partial [Mucuna pruriens]